MSEENKLRAERGKALSKIVTEGEGWQAVKAIAKDLEDGWKDELVTTRKEETGGKVLGVKELLDKIDNCITHYKRTVEKESEDG